MIGSKIKFDLMGHMGARREYTHYISTARFMLALEEICADKRGGNTMCTLHTHYTKDTVDSALARVYIYVYFRQRESLFISTGWAK